MLKSRYGVLRLGVKYLPLLAFAATILIPLSIVFFGALKAPAELFKNPFLPPQHPVLQNLATAFFQGNMPVYFRNTLFISGVSLVFILGLSCLTAYAITRRGFRWSGWIYGFFAFGILIPAMSLMVPMYMMMARLGLVNTPWSVILVYVGTSLPFAIFILSGFFRTIPAELDEAASIDGCTEFQAFWWAILPLCAPAISTVFILNLLAIWNDFFNPLLFIRSEDLKTISLGLTKYMGRYVANYPIMFSAVLIASVPVIAVFLLLQRQFVSGITAGAVKG